MSRPILKPLSLIRWSVCCEKSSPRFHRFNHNPQNKSASNLVVSSCHTPSSASNWSNSALIWSSSPTLAHLSTEYSHAPIWRIRSYLPGKTSPFLDDWVGLMPRSYVTSSGTKSSLQNRSETEHSSTSPPAIQISSPTGFSGGNLSGDSKDSSI